MNEEKVPSIHLEVSGGVTSMVPWAPDSGICGADGWRQPNLGSSAGLRDNSFKPMPYHVFGCFQILNSAHMEQCSVLAHWGAGRLCGSRGSRPGYWKEKSKLFSIRNALGRDQIYERRLTVFPGSDRHVWCLFTLCAGCT